MVKGKLIKQFILENVTKHQQDIVHLAVNKFGISKQTVSRHLCKLKDDGLVLAEGNTRNRKYKLKPLSEETFRIPIVSDLEENRIWREYVQPLLTGVEENIYTICHHGFTEMFNNVIDHSESSRALINIEQTAVDIRMMISDDGIGIFNKIKTQLGLEDERHAILELSKGKLTTDPEKHTGEGVFFTSRMFDNFALLSWHLYFGHTEPGDGWLLEDHEKETQGTCVSMTINLQSKRTTQAVYDRFSKEGSVYSFSSTHVPVKLAQYDNDKLVSRSQAKRLLARFDHFKEVFLDFKGVETIGQAFADEIFRVFRNENPDIDIISIWTNEEVKKMIGRVQVEDEKQLSLLEQ
jgi:anti-sigma regulatory factor (Ser/Thr protein kinase)